MLAPRLCTDMLHFYISHIMFTFVRVSYYYVKSVTRFAKQENIVETTSSGKSNVSTCRDLFPAIFIQHMVFLTTFSDLANIYSDNWVNKVSVFSPVKCSTKKWWREGTVNPSTDTEGNGAHAIFFLFKGTVSFQFAAVRLLHVDIGNLSHSISYIFSQLFAQLYHKGHNGFTHSQCTSLQSNEGGTTVQKKMVRLFFFFSFLNLPNPQRGSKAEHPEILFSYTRCIKGNLYTP